MLGSHFYNETIRRTVIGFGTLFNNIDVKTRDPETNEVLETEKVALAYGPKQKFLYRLFENPSTQKVAITMPRIYFEMTGISYDSARKTSPVQKYKNVIEDNGNEVRVQYLPVPYTLNFELGILSKDQDTGLQILEQILPFFQPSFNITLKMIPDMDEKRDVSVTLNSVNLEDEWDESFLNRRLVVYTLQFSAKTYLYGPVTDAKTIKKAIVDYYADTNTTSAPRNVRYTITPDPITADADDDFGFSELKAEFEDQKKRNPVSGVDEDI